MEGKKPFLSRPKDRTLEAYKAWMQEIIRNIAPNAKKTMTEEKWTASWKKFWKSDNPLEAK